MNPYAERVFALLDTLAKEERVARRLGAAPARLLKPGLIAKEILVAIADRGGVASKERIARMLNMHQVVVEHFMRSLARHSALRLRYTRRGGMVAALVRRS